MSLGLNVAAGVLLPLAIVRSVFGAVDLANGRNALTPNHAPPDYFGGDY